MNSDKNTDQTLRSGRKNTGLTPSAEKLQRIMGPSPACRMLTPYEIELLRKCAKEVAEVTRQVLAKKNDKEQGV